MTPKELIKERLSILDVVSSYIKTEKSGSQYKARCPFHNEKTPSFYISISRGTYHCFGCQAHGDIFGFVENIEKIPFIDALKMLADRAGVTLGNMEHQSADKRLLALLNDGTEYFEQCLTQSPSAKSYLLERGMNEETIKTFRIGFAPNEWRNLGGAMMSKGYSVEEIEKAGLIIKSEKGYYDRFRGRVMFPIRNIGGATVGYSGRILPQFDENKDHAKYVNTPETDVYHKSRILFGYDTAKSAMHDTKEVIIVEGQMDLCMSYQAGVKNTIAVSGTAFTDEHINLIKRFVEKVKLSFDQDKAGRQALLKSAKMCLLAGLDVEVVVGLGDDKDPADVIKNDKQIWLNAVNNTIPVIDWASKEILGKVTDPLVRLRLLNEIVVPLLSSISSPLVKDYNINKVAKDFGVSAEAVKEALGKSVASSNVGTVQKDETKINRKSLTDHLISIKSYLVYKNIFEKFIIENDEFKELLSFEYPEEILSLKQMEIEGLNDEKQVAYFKDHVFTARHIIIDTKIQRCKETFVDGHVDTKEVMRLIDIKKKIVK